ncbi:MAG: hypothetical protein ACFCVA_00215, partial [Gammaproteobacteria bacterium]
MIKLIGGEVAHEGVVCCATATAGRAGRTAQSSAQALGPRWRSQGVGLGSGMGAALLLPGW